MIFFTNNFSFQKFPSSLNGKLSWLFLILMLSGCSGGLDTQDKIDFKIVTDSCLHLKNQVEQDACIQSAVRLTGKSITDDDMPKRSIKPVEGTASEEILFKGVGFGRADESIKLIDICPKPLHKWQTCPTKESLLGNCPKSKDITIEARCLKLDDHVIIFMSNIDYGNLSVHPIFDLTPDGVVNQVSFTGLASEMQGIILSLGMRFGSPAIKKSEVQNAVGNKFEVLAATWIDARGTVLEVKAGGQNGKVNGGSLSIRSANRVISDAKLATKKLMSAEAKL